MELIQRQQDRRRLAEALTCSVVMDLCTCIRCGMTASSEPCHLQVPPGHGQVYGLNSHTSSWSGFSL